MTVGLALVANRPLDAAEKGTGPTAIVLVADKQITFGTGIKTESEVEKKLSLNGSWHLLFAGEPSIATKVAQRMRKHADDEFREIGTVAEIAEQAFSDVWDQAFDRQVLRRHLLTRKLVTARPKTLADLPPILLADYYRAKVQFEIDYGCDLILAGFDATGKTYRGAFVVLGDGEAEVDQMTSFRAIGEGEDVARARLIELNAQASDPLFVALYNALAAKFASESVASVGQGTDAWILRPGEKEYNFAQPHRVDPALIDAVREVIRSRNPTPWPWKKPDELHPEPNWQNKLKEYTDEVMSIIDAEPTWGSAIASSNEYERLSSRSQNASPRSTSQPAPSRPSGHRAGQARPQPDSSRPSPRGRSGQR